MWLCPLLGGAAAAHTAAFLLLYKQQLWRNLIMMPLGTNMGGVSVFPIHEEGLRFHPDGSCWIA